VAEYGKMFTTTDKNSLVIELHNGEMYKEFWQNENAAITKPFLRMKFKDQLARIDLSSFKMQRTDPGLFKDNHQMLNGSQLLAYIDTMKQEVTKDKTNFYSGLQSAYLPKTNVYWKSLDTLEIKPKTENFLSDLGPTERARIYELALNNTRNCKSAADSKQSEIDSEQKSILRFKIEYWRKFSLSFACLLMFFIGAPLGALIRKGGLGMPVVVSIFFFLIYWVLSIIGEKLSKEGTIAPEIGMWFACIFFVPLGFWLTFKATADRGMFDGRGMLRFLLILSYLVPWWGIRFRRMIKKAEHHTPNTEIENTIDS
jgi:lipopolysaccharide export system permease protein